MNQTSLFQVSVYFYCLSQVVAQYDGGRGGGINGGYGGVNGNGGHGGGISADADFAAAFRPHG